MSSGVPYPFLVLCTMIIFQVVEIFFMLINVNMEDADELEDLYAFCLKML